MEGKLIKASDGTYVIAVELKRPAEKGECLISKERVVHSNVGYNFGDLLVTHSTNLLLGVKNLSLKNCEEITNGYDLDELACDEIGIDISVIKHIDNKSKETDSPCTSLHEGGCVGSALYHRMKGFEIGFQKALEILGDNKFSEEDMINFAEYCKGDLMKTKDLFNEYQSLQQTEFDVEIEMEKYGYCEGCNSAGMWHCAHADSCGNAVELERPKLDSDGCLIFKKKV